MKTALALLSLSLLCACNASAPQPAVFQPRPVLIQANGQPVSQGITKAKYQYSADKSTLTLTMDRDTGDTLEMITVSRGGSVSAETIIKRGGGVVSRKPTLSSEADLAVKVAANNGWQDVHGDLKARYTAAGLL